MSAQPRPQGVPTTSGDQLGGSRQEPGVGERPRLKEKKLIKSTRFEVGFFVRKVVDGRVVHRWQFPPGKHRPEDPARTQKSEDKAAAGGGTDPKAEPGSQPQVRALAFEAAAPETAPSTDGSTDSSGDSSSTTYEVGFFVRTETVSPPDYGTSKGGSDPPPDP